MTAEPTLPLFELGGLFATVETIATTPIDELTLPRERVADPAEVRAMFAGLGWSTTAPADDSSALF